MKKTKTLEGPKGVEPGFVHTLGANPKEWNRNLGD